MHLSLDELNGEQRKAVEELRMRVKDTLDAKMYTDILTFYRFLEAREFRLNDAESMFRKFFCKYAEPSVIGFDKEGSLVLYIPGGAINVKDLYKCEKKNYLIRCLIWSAEKHRSYQIKHNEKFGKNATQYCFIMNLDQISLENVTSKEMIDFSVNLLSINQDNYPEYMKAVYIINAPVYFNLLFTIVRAFMSNKTIMKIHNFGQRGWKEKLLEAIDADILPAFLGGNRTDPDGNPLCTTFINHGGTISAKYFVSNEERYFTNSSDVKKFIVPHKERKEIYIDVKTKGTCIHWEFYCKSNIGFGLLYENSDKKIDEIFPVVKYDTSDGTEKYFYKTRFTGKYVIIFDNTFSLLRNKEVEYCIEVINP